MPVIRKGKKYAIGHGKSMYKSKAKAERAYKGYMAHKHSTMMEDAAYHRKHGK